MTESSGETAVKCGQAKIGIAVMCGEAKAAISDAIDVDIALITGNADHMPYPIYVETMKYLMESAWRNDRIKW